MRPSISVTLEPGLERGVPWGRDLYTFVTSAAGHMMRTLQKPRKKRPSKRQVNHRRFLYNMIQRKFADIEAANHRLASALYFKEEGKNVVSPSSQTPETLEQSSSSPQVPDTCNIHTDADGIPKAWSDVSVGSRETEISKKKQPDSGHLRKRQPKSQPTTCTATKNNQSKERQKEQSRNQLSSSSSSMSSPEGIDYHHGAKRLHTECYNNESQLKSTNYLSEDPGVIQFGQNVDSSPSFSPELSPLSINPCDFSVQLLTDISTCTQAQKSIADISESQWTDIMDLFSVGNKDLGGCMDVEAFFESICACQGDAGQEVGADDVEFTDKSDSSSNKSEVEDLQCETGEYIYEYSCHDDQGMSINHFQSDQRSLQAPRQNDAEMQFNNFKPNQEADIIQNQLPTPISFLYNASELSPCMLGGGGSRLCSEEGVGVPGSPEEGVGEAGGSSESEFSNERSSTSALRPRNARGNGARLDKKRGRIRGGDLSGHALAAVGELLQLSLQLPLLGVGARVVLLHLLQLPLQLLQSDHGFIQLGGGRDERGGERSGAMEGKRRKKDHVTEVGVIHEIGEQRGTRREKDGFIKREISLGTGGLIGIGSSQIKPGRLSPMTFWEESHCSSIESILASRAATLSLCLPLTAPSISPSRVFSSLFCLSSCSRATSAFWVNVLSPCSCTVRVSTW
ncbi:hypothetical protein FQN60_017051, partial [Etheostoma spectabile]